MFRLLFRPKLPMCAGINETFLLFFYSWKRLRMTTTVDGQVSVRAIAKTFASGKTEKLVHQTLAEVGFPSGKVCAQSHSFAVERLSSAQLERQIRVQVAYFLSSRNDSEKKAAALV